MFASTSTVADPPAIERVEGTEARPTISVVIPTFEPQPFLLETIKSVLDQELGDDRIQVVIVDDGSRRTNVRVNLSIGTLDEDVWRATEPGTPVTLQRTDGVKIEGA